MHIVVVVVVVFCTTTGAGPLLLSRNVINQLVR